MATVSNARLVRRVGAKSRQSVVQKVGSLVIPRHGRPPKQEERWLVTRSLPGETDLFQTFNSSGYAQAQLVTVAVHPAHHQGMCSGSRSIKSLRLAIVASRFGRTNRNCTSLTLLPVAPSTAAAYDAPCQR